MLRLSAIAGSSLMMIVSASLTSLFFFNDETDLMSTLSQLRSVVDPALIFGLGVIAHEMVAGRRLFLGESDFSTLQRVRKADVRPLTLDRDDVEEEFSDAVLGALKRDPKNRYSDASEFACS